MVYELGDIANIDWPVCWKSGRYIARHGMEQQEQIEADWEGPCFNGLERCWWLRVKREAPKKKSDSHAQYARLIFIHLQVAGKPSSSFPPRCPPPLSHLSLNHGADDNQVRRTCLCGCQ